jgi:hypothetical protein
MTTTLNSVKSAIEKLVAGLTPTGSALSQRKYLRASDYQDWRDRPLADVDRRYTIEMSPDGGWKSYGTLTEHEATSRLTVIIGHIKGQKAQDTQERRDTDLRQIALELQDPANRPTGVWRIASVPPVSVVDIGQWWESTLKFDVTFAEANP